jgi:hypothetical protein
MPTVDSKAQQALDFSDGGVVSSRSIMLPELSALLAIAPADANVDEFWSLAIDEDALNKASAANRLKTFTKLRRLYGLNPNLPTFREFRRLSLLFPSELPALAGALAFAREPLLRASADMVLNTPIGAPLSRASFEAWVREYASGRFSQTMYRSFSHNLYASFSQIGYLGVAVGKCRLRQRVDDGTCANGVMQRVSASCNACSACVISSPRTCTA